MSRRRRRRKREREIVFSFDSFLDVVANVCGIIIRLMLVVWVGARSYTALKERMNLPEAPTGTATEPDDAELAEERRALAEAEEALLRRLRELERAQNETAERAAERQESAEKLRLAVAARDAARRDADAIRQAAAGTLPSAEELRDRCHRLAEEVKTLEALPPLRRELRYRTPVSKPVDAEELMFECRRGRVAFVDVAALLDEVKRGLRDKSEALKRTWEVEDVAGPVGPFRLRYAVERLRDGPGGVPDPNASFRYGVNGWRVEPVTEARGESLDEALKRDSDFRQIVDRLDPRHAAVTFWVYPDSFPEFRNLRDYLYEKDVVVAGRPLPEGAPIASSRQGTTSRGQ